MLPKRPNIVFLMPDQLRHDFLSCYGASFIQTPNIDSIAEQGVRYDNAYSASPLCVPARTSLLAGMNAIRTGVLDNQHALRPDYNQAGIRTWPQILSDQGYYTAAIGKMHFYPWDARHGFDRRVVCEDKLWPNIRDDYHYYLRKHGLQKLKCSEYGGFVANLGAARTDVPWEHSWDRFTGKSACHFIDNYEGDRPFAMMVGFPGPHDPYDPAFDFPEKFDPDDMPAPIPSTEGDPAGLVALRTNEYRQQVGIDLTKLTEQCAKSNRAHYAGLVKQIDHEVGAILDALRRRNLLEDTVVVFSSDHGDLLGDHGMQGKAMYFEGSAHIPLLVRMPGATPGRVCDDLVELRDITATMLRLAGSELPDYMDAQPLPELGLSDAPPRNRIFGMLLNGWMTFDGQWKLCKYATSDTWLLYDLATDPHEQRNVADDPANRDIVERLDAELTREIMASMMFAMHDRLVSADSFSRDDSFGYEGWQWEFPAPASGAANVGLYLP